MRALDENFSLIWLLIGLYSKLTALFSCFFFIRKADVGLPKTGVTFYRVIWIKLVVPPEWRGDDQYVWKWLYFFPADFFRNKRGILPWGRSVNPTRRESGNVESTKVPFWKQQWSRVTRAKWGSAHTTPSALQVFSSPVSQTLSTNRLFPLFFVLFPCFILLEIEGPTKCEVRS